MSKLPKRIKRAVVDGAQNLIIELLSRLFVGLADRISSGEWRERARERRRIRKADRSARKLRRAMERGRR